MRENLLDVIQTSPTQVRVGSTDLRIANIFNARQICRTMAQDSRCVEDWPLHIPKSLFLQCFGISNFVGSMPANITPRKTADLPIPQTRELAISYNKDIR